MTPDFLGTLPGWITATSTTTGLAAIVIAYLRRGVSLKGIASVDEADRRDHIAEEMAALRENVAGLRKELHDCEEECRKHISRLQEEVWGEKRQRVAEQISLINTIISTVDAPELSKLLATLESIQRRLTK